MKIQYPAPGCIVEFLEDNSIQTAYVLEEASGKLRLLLPNRRELKLAPNRLLPWSGPMLASNLTREDARKALEEAKKKRDEKSRAIPILEAWELAQGELEQAPAEWFAELLENEPDIDAVAAYGRALLECKSHFRFQPPNFLIYDAETVNTRLEEKRQREEREALIAGGANFLRTLWEIASKKKPPIEDSEAGKLLPDQAISQRIERLLKARVANPWTEEDSSLWELISHSLPEVPHLPFQLLQAWGKYPKHYNFWLDRADYESGDAWWRESAPEVARLEAIASCSPESPGARLEVCELPFISVDGETTFDIDDAFHMERLEDGWRLTLALACPALGWDFGHEFNRKVMRRATSLYFPEGDLHMLPKKLGTDAFSLLQGKKRPALCLELELDQTGAPRSFRPFLAQVELAANLRYPDVEKVIEARLDAGPMPENPAANFQDQLWEAHAWANLREQWRIGQGAVIMQRPEPQISLGEDPENPLVALEAAETQPHAQRLVTEMMVLAGTEVAEWASKNSIPLIHRTQNVALPKEYAGIWQNPEDIARIIKSLVPSILEVTPKPHSALGASRYVQITSPLRRYADLVNEAQVIGLLQDGRPRWSGAELESLLLMFTPSLEAATQAQKFRPRYWRLLYFQQQGDKVWWPGVVTEENENFAMVNLPAAGVAAKGRREIFDDRACPGARVLVRIGKVNPLYNEIHVIEAMPDE